jgi:WD40 repeat protein/3',5'-cyclic AMP phosphodiesterase CpdA
VGAAAGGGGDYDFFVSYTGADAAWAEWIAWQLETGVRLGGRPAKAFVQAWDLVPGTNWAHSMHRTLPASARVVPVLSAAYLADSRYGNAEWLVVWPDDPEGLRRRVVPVRVGQCRPGGLLRTIVYIDLVGLDEEEATAKLLSGIAASLEGRVKPPAAPAFPGRGGHVPHSAGRPAFPGPAGTDPALEPPGHTSRIESRPASGSGTGLDRARGGGRADASFRGEPEERAVTVLHISDTRFGAHHVFGEAGRSPSALFPLLHDDLRDRAEREGLRPDLVVVTGDLTETGARGEFDQAYDFLVALAGALSLSRHQIAIIPGDHDVNRMLCAAYFLQCAADEEPPVPPYWPKWRFFDALLRRFYGADVDVGFQVGAEWSLFTIPECKVVVAGLNSTMAETHENHYGWLGEHQLRWFAGALSRSERDGWLRIGAVHHNPIPGATSDDENLRDADDLNRILGPHLNLLLPGHTSNGQADRLPSGLPVAPTGGAPVGAHPRQSEVPYQYQLIRIDRDGFTRYVRRYERDQRRWVGEGRVDPDGNSWSMRTRSAFQSVSATFPPPPGELGGEEGEPGRPLVGRSPGSGRPDPVRHRPPDILDEIAEVARLRYPDATVERVEAAGEAPAHLRVRRAEGWVAEQRILGVLEGEADATAVEEFVRTVRRKYTAAFPILFSDLVYTGRSQATPQLVAEAERMGVRLLSMPEYQGVLDLRGYVERQTARLRADPDYSPDLYVPQRIRRVDQASGPVPGHALEQIVEWLTTDEARFILVLGGFGHGKTFLTHKLALELPKHLPHVVPMLVELRQLERPPDLNRLVAQHLVASQVRRPDLDAFRYMLRKGRLVLLVDGFDEVAARVTYERAVAYLDILLAALDDQAKILVTSRAEFFLTDREVLTKTGERVEQSLGRFIVRLEEFTPEQIHDFLVGRFMSTLASEFPDIVSRRTEAQRRAAARLELIRDVRELPDLARNPRLLSFITELDEDRLRATRQRAGTGAVTAADLYQELIDQWLVYESNRSPELTKAEREAAVAELAVALWREGETFLDVARLTEIAGRVLQSMRDPRGLTPAETTHLLGSGTALRRDEEGRFSFIHRSVMEYLVVASVVHRRGDSIGPGAGEATELSVGERASRLFSQRELSTVMAEFFIDLATPQQATAWAYETAQDPKATAAAKANALRVAGRLGTPLPARANLAGANLAGKDLSGRDLRGADLRGVNLRDATLTDTRLDGADLTEAVLAGAKLLQGTTLVGAVLHRTVLTRAIFEDVVLHDAELHGADVSWARLSNVDLTSADLSGAVFIGAVLQSVNLTGAVVQGSRWQLAKVVSAELDSTTAEAPELASAAVAGRDPARAVISPASNSVSSVAFSSDGSLVASAGDDRVVRLWEVATGRARALLAGHSDRIRSVAFSPDGSLLASAGDDRVVGLWEVATSWRRAWLVGHTSRVMAVDFSPDGTLVASAGGSVRLWEVAADGERLSLAGHGGAVSSVAFSPDGSLLASAVDDRVMLWEVATGRELVSLDGHTDRVRSVAFSPDGSLLASAGDDWVVRLWEVATGRQRASLAGHAPRVRSVSFWRPRPGALHDASDQPGAQFASAGDDGVVRLWNISTYQEKTLVGHTDLVRAVAFSPDGSLLATACTGNSGSTRLWEVVTGQGHTMSTGNADPGWSTAFSPDGSLLASAGDDGSVRLWDVVTRREYASLADHNDDHNGRVLSVAFSPDGSLLASAGDDGSVRLWDVATRRRRGSLTGHNDRVWSVAFSPDGSLLASAGDDGSVRLWDVATRRRRGSLTGHSGPVWSVAFSPDGSLLAGGGADESVLLWKVATRQLPALLTGHTGPVSSVAFSKDGSLLASAGDDGSVRLWEVAIRRERASLTGHSGRVWTVAYSPDGSLLASADASGSVLLWEVATGHLVAHLVGLDDGGWSALLPSGSYKVVGDPGNRLWWAIKTARFGVGELDHFYPEIQHIPLDTPLPRPPRPLG